MTKRTLDNRQLYAQYSLEDFDKYDCLKLSKGIYFILLFVLRGYIVWIMSVTNMRDRVSIIEFVYPEPQLFYISLCSGAVGLFVVVLLALRRPDASAWVKTLWPHSRKILLFALLFDFIASMLGFWYWQYFTLTTVIAHIIMVTGFSVYLYQSHRFRINLMEFPQALPTDK